MQDDKTVDPVIVVGNDANQFPPMFKPHIARIDWRVEREGMNIEIETPQFRHFVDDKVEIETLQSPRFRVLPHATGNNSRDRNHGGKDK